MKTRRNAGTFARDKYLRTLASAPAFITRSLLDNYEYLF